ncbi:MAG: 3-deoxy-D-manno-octulosonic acid transferase [Candidatus Omnitrophota bacterium]|nr:MAG: 3-deoxy-D-manno-octulosonic acid transferase [Candidatus Omnitrophota bacterium]
MMNNKKTLIKERLSAPIVLLLFFVYDILFLLGFILYLPIYFCRKKINFRALKEKFGFSHLDERQKNCIWIHVVSVGEAQLVGTFIEKLKDRFDQPIVISTTTLTGHRIAKQKYNGIAKVIYFPYDVSLILTRLLDKIHPRLFVAVETEIWPNLFYRLKRRNIPIVLVNGRISDKAFAHYKKIKMITKPVLNWCHYVAVQNQAYKERFIDLGCEPEKVLITGNMKFESILVDEEHLEKIKTKYSSIVKGTNKLLIIAASTHHPEEEIILKVYQEILTSCKNISLLIAPRHVERIPLIEKNIISSGFEPLRISSLKGKNTHKKIFLLDTIGQLLYFYALADICFVGGSLTAHGGHNILEPIYFQKPTIFGPSMENFQDFEEIALNKGAGIKIENTHQLREITLQLINNKALRDSLAEKCRKVFSEEKKSLDKHIELISKCLQ